MTEKYKNFKNKLTKECPACGADKSIANKQIIKPPLLGLKDVVGERWRGFYGGNVSKFCMHTCECGQEMLLYIRQVNGNLTVHDLAIEGEPIDISADLGDNDNEDNEPVFGQSEKDVTSSDDTIEDDSLTQHDIDVENESILAQSLLDGDEETAMEIFKSINIVKIPGVLISVGVPSKDVRNGSKLLKKPEYEKIIKDFIAKVKEAN